MAVLAISALGAGAGAAIGGTATFLGVSSAGWGWMVGSLVGNMLFAPDGPDEHGPRLNDATYTGNVEGTDMPVLWGGDRLPGKPIFLKNPPREVKKTEETGGKGGGGGGSYTTYTYYQDFALCFGAFYGAPPPRRVWANNELIYDASGDNGEVISEGFSFSWYSGDSDEVDALIEGVVGEGNCPSYKGRCVMVISALNLTKKFGNRIPVIEAEIQTTGNESLSDTDYNLGEYEHGAPAYTDLGQLLRHPSLPEFVALPTLNANGWIRPIFRVDMAGRYLETMAEIDDTINSVSWWSDPYSYTNQVPVYLLASQYHAVSGNTLYKIEYPSGKIISEHTLGASFLGGAEVGPESQFYYFVSHRNLSSSYYFLNKLSLALSGPYNFGDDETSFDNSNLDSGLVCTDFYNGEWVFFGSNSAVNTRTAMYALRATGSPRFERVAEPFYDYFGFDNGDFSAEPGKLVYIEENDEVWAPITYTTKSADPGMGVFDATTGELKEYFDFVNNGWTTTAAYWPIATGTPVIHYDSQSRRITFGLSGVGLVGSVHVDTRNFQWYQGGTVGGGWNVYYANRNSVWSAAVVGVDDEFIFTETKLGLVSQGTVAISTVVADILERCGVAPTEYDVSALTGKTIGSFIHGTRHDARQDIEALLSIAQADAVQSDNKIQFVLRGGSAAATLPLDNLGAQELRGEQAQKDPIKVMLPMEHEIPRVFELQFRSMDNVYQPGIAQSYIATGESESKRSAQLPCAITDQQAGDLCEAFHQQTLDPNVYDFDLPVRYFYLEPTDVLEVPVNSENHRVRLTRVERGANWIMRCKAIADHAEDYQSSAVVPGVDAFVGTLPTTQTPVPLIIDGPLLRDVDNDNPGPYLTSFVYSNSYPVASWWYSPDDSAFALLFAQGEQPTTGIVDTASNSVVWEQWDDLSQIDVTIMNGGSLSSSTKGAIEADATINAFAYGRPGRWEYLNAATVTLLESTPNLRYRLTNLLRGRRGTDNHIQLHENKDYLVKIELSAGISRHTLQNSQIGNGIYYRVPQSDLAVSDVISREWTVGQHPLKPYSPITVTGTKHATTTWQASTVYALGDEVEPTVTNGYRYVCATAGTSSGTEPSPWGTTVDGTTNDGSVVWRCENLEDFDISWVRRTRRGGSLGGPYSLTDGVGGSLEEDDEEYEIDFTNKTTETVLGTVTGLTSTSYEYLQTLQDTHGTLLLGQFYLDIYQMSAVVGRGFRGRSLFDRGWGSVINTAIDLGAAALFPLNDAAGSNAKEWITGNDSAGTYTSASAGTAALSGDRYAPLVGDGSGYMKCGTLLRDLLSGGQSGTVVGFVRDATVSGDNLLDITQGGNQYRIRVASLGTSLSTWVLPSTSGAAAQSTSNADSEGMNGRVAMFSLTIDLDGTFEMRVGINGRNFKTTSYSTGHSGYASTFEDQSRDANYNDTIAAQHNVTPSNILSQGAVAFVALFQSSLSDANLYSLYQSVIEPYANLIEGHDDIYLHVPLDDDDGTTQAPSYGVESFTINSMTDYQRSITLGAEASVYCSSHATSKHLYRDLSSEFKRQTFTIQVWIDLQSNLTTDHFLLTMQPRDWNGSTKRGVHVMANSTYGLQLWVGTGGASFETIVSGSGNMTGGNLYLVTVTVDAVNGIKLYLNDGEVGTALGAKTIEWDDNASGYPDPATLYINGGTTTGRLATNLAGAHAYYSNFHFYTGALSAAEIAEQYNVGSGVVS